MGNDQPKTKNETNQEFYTFELIQDALNLKILSFLENI